MAQTLPLSADWDLQLDPTGNLILLSADASIAQDVASSIRCFLAECWYATNLGMPYFQSIFGQRPPASFVKSQITQNAMAVKGVNTVNVVSLALNKRVLTGSIRINGSITVTF